MKALLLATLLLGTLEAEEPCWKLVSAKAGPPIGSMAQWTFTIRNVSGEARKIAEDWRTKGNASVNLCLRLGGSGHLMNLLSEPCHGPQSHLDVPPGATITAVIHDLAGFDRDKLLLTIVEGGERTVIGTLSECTAKVLPDPADPSVPAPEPKAAPEANPAPVPEGSPGE
jgi:hypothetical protein